MPRPTRIPSLELAESLLETEPGRALGALLAVYRATFSPRVAGLVERLGATLGTPLEGLPLKQREHGEALSVLALRLPEAERSSLLEAFALFAGNAQGKNVWPGVELLRGLEPDPRIARLALRLLVTPRAVPSMTAKLFRRLVSCVERHGHAELAPALRAAVLPFHDPRRVANVATRLEKRVPGAVDEASLSRLEQRVVSPLAPSRPQSAEVPEAALLSSIVAAPGDDAPRLMYADWLIERQLPLGEFISLQIARAHGRVTKEARHREAELLQRHRTQFLGPFDRRVTLSGNRFERGFLVRCSMSGELPRHPLVRLLEDVEFDGSKIPRELQFDSLRAVRNLSIELLPELMERAPRLERAMTNLFIFGTAIAWTMTRELLKRLPRSLRHLGFNVRPRGALAAQAEPLAFLLRESFAIPQLAALESLHIVHGGPLALGPEGLKVLPAGLQELTVEFQAPWLTLRLVRTGAGWTRAEVSGDLLDPRASRMWELLAGLGCTELRLRGASRVYDPGPLERQLAAWPSLNATLG